jgi:hypothetical protein
VIFRRSGNHFADFISGCRGLEHVPEKWTRFSDKDMLPKFLNWREFFFDQVIPPDRKAR